MKNLKKSWRRMTLAMALAVSLLFLMAVPNFTAAGASDVCNEAWQRCIVDALLVALFSGPTNFVIFSGFCTIGYEWCERYI